MTIDEAIVQLENLRKCEIYLWSKDIQAIDMAIKALEENAELKEENDTLKTEIMAVKSGSEVLKICKLEEETAELKRLLRLAVEEMTKQKLYADLGMMSRGALCKSCKTRSVTNRVCQVCNYEYEHAEEALKLIGDDKQ